MDKINNEFKSNNKLFNNNGSNNSLNINKLIKQQSNCFESPINPFIDATNNTVSLFEVCKITINIIFLIPLIKFLLIFITIIFCTLYCLFLSLLHKCIKNDKTFRIFMQPLRIFPRICLFIFGFFYIPVEGRPSCCGGVGGCCGCDLCLNNVAYYENDIENNTKDLKIEKKFKRSNVIVCNHTTLLDVFVLMVLFFFIINK